jgi:hypothetical protein
MSGALRQRYWAVLHGQHWPYPPGLFNRPPQSGELEQVLSGAYVFARIVARWPRRVALAESSQRERL